MMLLILLILLVAGSSWAQDLSDTNIVVTIKRRLTEKEEKAALLYHEDNWIAYRIALYDRHLATALGPDVPNSMRRHLLSLKAEAEKGKAEHIIWGKIFGLVYTNDVTDKDVVWSDVVTTNSVEVSP